MRQGFHISLILLISYKCSLSNDIFCKLLSFKFIITTASWILTLLFMHAIVNIHNFGFYSRGNRCLERWSALCKISQPINGRAWFELKFVEPWSPSSFYSVILYSIHLMFSRNHKSWYFLNNYHVPLLYIWRALSHLILNQP